MLDAPLRDVGDDARPELVLAHVRALHVHIPVAEQRVNLKLSGVGVDRGLPHFIYLQ